WQCCAWYAAAPVGGRSQPLRPRALALRLGDAFGKGRVAETGKCCVRAGDVERTIAVMRHRAAARAALDGYLAWSCRNDCLRDSAERMHFSARHVEGSCAATLQDAHDNLGDVVDQHMIAPFLAVSEQNDFITGVRQSAESIGAVAVVRVVRAVEEGRPQNCQWRFDGICKGQLASQMHGAM